MRKWAARLPILAAGLLLALGLVLAAALAVLDDEDYRAALVWAAQEYLDATLAVDGTLSIELGPTLTLHAQGLRLQTNDGRISVSITELGTQLKLRPLLSKTIWLEDLTIVGARFDVHRPPAARDERSADGLRVLPNILLEEARLLDVAFARHTVDDTVQELRIDQLLIDEARDQGSTVVDGRGEFNGQQIALAGTLGSHAQLLDTAMPFPLDLELNSGTLSLALTGSIADPIEGRGIDVKLRANDPDLAASLALLGQQVPPLGMLHIEANIAGAHDALQFQQLRLSLQRNEQLDITIEGDIGNLQAATDVKLELSGTLKDAAVWQWLTAGSLAGFDRGIFRGSLRDQSGAYHLTDINIEAASASGLKLGIEGAITVDPETAPLSEPDIDLSLHLSAPSQAALAPLVDHGLPDLGPVDLSARLTGRPPLLEFKALDATAGSQKEHRFVFSNGRGRLDLREDSKLQQATLPMILTTPKPAVLSRLFGLDLPTLGNTTLKGTWQIDGATIGLEQFESSIQLPGGGSHRLSGTIMQRAGRGLSADVSVDLDTDQLLALWTDDTPAELGRIAGSIQLQQTRESWELIRFRLESSQTDLLLLKVAGTDGEQARDRQEISLRLRIDEPQKLFVNTRPGPPPFAPVTAGGTLIHGEGHYRYQGDVSIGKTRSTLNLAARFEDARPIVSGDINTPLLTLSDFGLPVAEPETPEAPKAANAKDSAETTGQKDDTPKTLFSREPLDLAWLQRLDLDISLQVDEIRGVNLEIDEAEGRIILESGRLRLSETAFRYFGGTASGHYELDARAVPIFKVDLKVDDLALADILAEFLPDTIQGGIMDLELKLEGRGQSAHEVASGLGGTLDLAFEKTKIPSAYVELLSADILGWTLGSTALSDGYSHIDCGVFGVDIESGVARSRVLLADGPNLEISGNATVNLGSETLDVVIVPKQKKTVFTNASPAKISGSMLDPKVEAIPTKAAATRIGKMVLLPQVFVPLEGLTQGWRLLSGGGGSSPGCTKVLGRSVEEGFAFEGAKPPTAE